MSTSKEVFALRKSGQLEEAYKMACELMESSKRGEWDEKAFAWCVIDLVKRDSKNKKLKIFHFLNSSLKASMLVMMKY